MLNFDEIAGLGGATERQELARLEGLLQFDDPINIQFTSGTTGHPKGATLTHHNILNNGYFIGEAMRLGEADRLCIPVPLYHCFGMVRSEEHTSELQSLMRTSYAVFCLKKKNNNNTRQPHTPI